MQGNIDEIVLNFNAGSLFLLNILLGFIMFGVALDLKVADFKRILSQPKSSLVGLLSQWVLLPVITLLIIYFMQPQISIALGMLLVAACPGGNISNFISKMAGGNTALSVSLTALTTSAAIVMTPLSFTFWSSFLPEAESFKNSISLNVWDMFSTIIYLILIPVLIGVLFAKYQPKVTEMIKRPINILSIIIFSAFVLIAFSKNADYFISYIHVIFVLVLLHNGFAFIGAYWLAKIFGLASADRKAISIETGIQNSGLGLILIFNFFDGLGGMAIVAGWWGIWHIISGLTLAFFWSNKKVLSLTRN
jgi:BASS family bile acid:Na+ symporter